MKNKITIPEPCHEDWNKMTPTAKGAFCSSCSKEVKDFTKSSDQEILNVIKNSKNTICGHISSKQMNRPLEPNQINLSKWTIPFAASFSLIVIPFSLSAQSERELIGKVAITKPYNLGEIEVVCSKPKDTIAESRSLKGNFKIEKNIQTDNISEKIKNKIYDSIKVEKASPKLAITPEIIVNGLMLIQPTKKDKKIDSLKAKTRLTSSKDTIRIDTIPFKPQEKKSNVNSKNNQPNANVFPNPTSNWTTIKLEAKGLYNLSMLNSTGQIILKKSFFGTALKVNLTDQPQGLYYISLINSEGIRSKNIKVIKTD